MRYISTRGGGPALSFKEIITSGLAPDGGLYMPETIPRFRLEEIHSWEGLAYQELALKVMEPYVQPDAAIRRHDLDEAYRSFGSDIAPLTEIGRNKYLLELFHGPTFAFKDFALQLLGRLLDQVLKQRKEEALIIGATSGDTGSAAIEGCLHSKWTKIFMLHPAGRPSELQRRQMTTVAADNVLNIAIKGSFDDCQELVKAMFRDPGFAGERRLVAVNSINWVRILAQIVYYFHAFLRLGAPHAISFSVPTGNFGDIFAGYIAYRMGLPIQQLIVATNSNDILHRFFTRNDYSKRAVVPTPSPSMDIQISSNFERLLFDLHDNNADKVRALMEGFQREGRLSIEPPYFKKVTALFDSFSTDEALTYRTMAELYKETGETIDPHTAAGVAAARAKRKDFSIPMVILATAHPAKFPDAVKRAGLSAPSLPALEALYDRPEHYTAMENDLETVKRYITDEA